MAEGDSIKLIRKGEENPTAIKTLLFVAEKGATSG